MSLFEDLLFFTGLSAPDLRRIIATSPARYKQFTIAKKSGGERLIAQPSRDLKVLQRYIQGNILSKGTIHASATAYKNGASIKHNANIHKYNRVILKCDFKDFFHSIKPRDWILYAQENFHSLSQDDVGLCARVLFWGRGTSKPACLSIGAPTSPVLSNLIMFDLDEKLTRSAEKIGATYTRYADDITLSADKIETVLLLEKRLKSAVAKSKYPKLTFNGDKRGLYTTAHRRNITGLNITPDEEISIGRDRKRMISSMIHKYSIGQLSEKDAGKLKGYLAFAYDCEPDFIERMIRKYGEEQISIIRQLHLPPRQRDIEFPE
ncbi:retron St85 family RNA-directed DNA polymerase [Neorhizobium galegae]|uniref:retron St85 family RNA-directed DNA polymerase n=1 Tax=Neorhizobium galegae TaxID=399 RepID=UPI0021029E50|nr:retron St85 family RNA-directed DNA polymerase [Neorhizobium galegae]MCQ1836953.1 retron St85 family RNA-directed DNA polymerase [Neorhizobium galegae]UIY30865.1 retron St85 family RNA-directed DNA polymerase [Neorhizobium galegae]